MQRLVIVLSLALSLVSFRVHASKEHLNHLVDVNDAQHLLMRTGFGSSPGEILQLLGKDRQTAINTIIRGISATPEIPIPAWVTAVAPHYWQFFHMQPSEKIQFQYNRHVEISRLRLWWVRVMIQTPSPQTERLTLFWHNHFATAYSNLVYQTTSVGRQNITLREMAFGNYRALLKAMVRDPALLLYLGNHLNNKESPTENLARELLEVFTLGEGHYSEQHVKQAARALTGYTFSSSQNMRFRLDHNRHDREIKKIFGQSGAFDGDDLIDLILDQPQAARFIAEKFWVSFVNETTRNAAVIEQLAVHFRDSDYHIEALYRATLESEAFWAIENRDSIVRSPVDLIVGSIRTAGLLPTDWVSLPATLLSMGQTLFDPPNVAGWAGGEAWITSSSLLRRFSWLEQYLSDKCLFSPSQECLSDHAIRHAVAQRANSRPDARDTMSQTDTEMYIELAADNYEGAPHFQVALIRNKRFVWKSATQVVKGGHDTRKFGRLSELSTIPWQVVRLSVDGELPEFDQIKLSYLYEASGVDGDRNLYVNWVKLNGQVYPAKFGLQRSECPPEEAYRAGRLYCSGDLMLSTTDSPSVSINWTANTLIADSVSPTQVQDASRHVAAKIEFALTGVQFNDRKWSIMRVGFHVDSKGQYNMSVESDKCWPECIKKWPVCARRSPHDADFRALDFPLRNYRQSSCHYDSLAAEDKLLIDTVWLNAARFYLDGKPNLGAKDSVRGPRYRSWNQHFKSMIKQTRQTTLVEAGSQLAKASIGAIHVPVETRLPLKPPLPTGRTLYDYQQDLAALVRQHSEVSMQTLLGGSKNMLENRNEMSQQLSVQLK